MFDLFKKLLFSRQLSLEKGKVLLLGSPMCVTPASIFIDVQKDLEKAIGKEKARKRIYEGSKKGGIKFAKKLFEAYKLKGEKLLRWEFDIVMLAGWGEFKMVNFDRNKKTMRVEVKNSPIAIGYGKSKTPVDCYIAGFAAGGATVAVGVPMKVKEIKCLTMGHRYCEFIAEPLKKSKIY